MIIKLTARYAMKREVAALRGRFFRGVCPISNRAKEFERLEPPGPPGRPILCLSKDVYGFSPAPESVRGFRFFDTQGGNTRTCVQKGGAGERLSADRVN